MNSHGLVCEVNSCHNNAWYKVTFDSGSLKKDDVWLLCETCNLNPVFKEFRISCKMFES